MADYMFTQTFKVGDTVQFTRSFRAESFAIRRKNRTYYNVSRGDEAIVTEANQGSYANSVNTYTVRMAKDGTVLSGIREFLIE